MTLAEPNADDFIAAQLSAVTLVQRFLTGQPTDLTKLLEDLPIDVALTALAMMASDLLKRHDEDQRTAYLESVRHQFIAGTFLPDNLK